LMSRRTRCLRQRSLQWEMLNRTPREMGPQYYSFALILDD
jgi:hypothetical protein